jgi:hypothetical protein
MAYGEDMPAGGGRTRRHLKFQQGNELIGDGHSVQIIDQALHVAIIVEDELVITCYHQRGNAHRIARPKARRNRTRRIGRRA